MRPYNQKVFIKKLLDDTWELMGESPWYMGSQKQCADRNPNSARAYILNRWINMSLSSSERFKDVCSRGFPPPLDDGPGALVEGG